MPKQLMTAEHAEDLIDWWHSRLNKKSRPERLFWLEVCENYSKDGLPAQIRTQLDLLVRLNRMTMPRK